MPNIADNRVIFIHEGDEVAIDDELDCYLERGWQAYWVMRIEGPG